MAIIKGSALSLSEIQKNWYQLTYAGTRASAPTVLANDTVFTNFNYDISGWNLVNLSADTVAANASGTSPGTFSPFANDDMNFYWYQRKFFYFDAATYTVSYQVDDDLAAYLTPIGNTSGTTNLIHAGGLISDTDGGSGTSNITNFQFTVSTPGIYAWTIRGVEGGGGDYSYISAFSGGAVYECDAPFDRFSQPQKQGAIIQFAQSRTNATTTTTDQTGFTLLETYITPTTAASKILVMACLFGWSGDDSIAYLQYNIGGGSWTQDTTLNGQGTFGGFADHSWSHRSNNGPMGASLMVQFWPNTTSQVGVRMRATSENNNNGGFWLNGGQMPTTAGGDYNSGSATSTLTLFEIAG